MKFIKMGNHKYITLSVGEEQKTDAIKEMLTDLITKKLQIAENDYFNDYYREVEEE